MFSGQAKYGDTNLNFDINKYIATCTDELEAGNVDVVLGFEMFMQACELCDARLTQAHVQGIVLNGCDKYDLPPSLNLPGMRQGLVVPKTLPGAYELVTNLSIAIAFLSVACLILISAYQTVAFIRPHPNGTICYALNGCTYCHRLPLFLRSAID